MAATTRTTWATATCPIRSLTRSASSASNPQTSARRTVGMSAAWSTSSPAPGSNAFHGEAFEFIRNNYIDATNFFSTVEGYVHQNQYRRHLRRTDHAQQDVRLRCLPAHLGRPEPGQHAGHRAHSRQPERATGPSPTAFPVLPKQPLQLDPCAHPVGRSAHRRQTGWKQICVRAHLRCRSISTANVSARHQSFVRSEQLRVCVLFHSLSAD